jgi:hypothetical protein
VEDKKRPGDFLDIPEFCYLTSNGVSNGTESFVITFLRLCKTQYVWDSILCADELTGTGR